MKHSTKIRISDMRWRTWGEDSKRTWNFCSSWAKPEPNCRVLICVSSSAHSPFFFFNLCAQILTPFQRATSCKVFCRSFFGLSSFLFFLLLFSSFPFFNINLRGRRGWTAWFFWGDLWGSNWSCITRCRPCLRSRQAHWWLHSKLRTWSQCQSLWFPPKRTRSNA